MSEAGIPQAGGLLEMSHTADIGFTIGAPTLDRLFELAAQGLARAVGVWPEGGEFVEEGGRGGVESGRSGEARASTAIRLQRPDRERLLVAWLRELLPRIQQGAVPARVRIRVDEEAGSARLEAEVRWRTDGNLPPPVREIKGVTYHGLRVRGGPDGWRVRVVLDV